MIFTNHIRAAARQGSSMRRWLLPCLFVVLLLIGHDAIMISDVHAAAPVGRDRAMDHARPSAWATLTGAGDSSTGHGDADVATIAGSGQALHHQAACGIGLDAVGPPIGERGSAPATQVVPVGATWVSYSPLVDIGAVNAPTAPPALRRALLQVYRL